MISLKSYLYTSIRNGCLNYLRNRKRRRDREACYYDDIDDERNFLDEIMESELYRQLKMLLEELPPQCRNIFERVLQGETSEEIATTMDLSVETVKTQRKKAKRILRERFTSLYDIFGYLL